MSEDQKAIYDFKGYLRVIDLAEIFHLLEMGGKSGMLRIEREPDVVELYVQQEELIWIESSRLNRTFENFIAERSLLEGNELFEAINICRAEDRFAVSSILEAGYLDPGTLIELSKEIFLDEIAYLLSWKDGHFQFLENHPLPGRIPLPVSLGLNFLILHAAQKRDNLDFEEDRRVDSVVSPPIPFTGKLVQVQNGRIIENFSLRFGTNIFGTGDDVDFQFNPESRLEERHARIYLTGLFYYLDDISKQSAVYVNGEKIDRQLLKDGDEIRMGALVFYFHRMPALSKKEPFE